MSGESIRCFTLAHKIINKFLTLSITTVCIYSECHLYRVSFTQSVIFTVSQIRHYAECRGANSCNIVLVLALWLARQQTHYLISCRCQGRQRMSGA
jgi:hypothetical protein